MYIKLSKMLFLAVITAFVGRAAAQNIDERAKKILDSPGVVEQFKKNEGQRNRQNGDQTAPLVKQAHEFALYLDPPAPPPKPGPKAPKIARPEPITPVTSNFDLLGTGCYTAKPQQSIALIDEPGKGLRWVRQGGTIGHFKVEQINDGFIIIDDGKGPQEVFAKKIPHISLVKSSIIEDDRNFADSPSLPATPDDLPPPEPVLSEEQMARQAEFIEALFAKVTAEGNEIAPEDLDILMSELNRITDEEANQIDKLGEILDQNQTPQPEAQAQPQPEPVKPPASTPARTRPARTRRLKP